MNTRQTRWLLAQLCPVCEQGSVLHFIVCPECDSLGAICDEDGACYLHARAISGETAVAPESIACAKFGVLDLADFPERAPWGQLVRTPSSGGA